MADELQDLADDATAWIEEHNDELRLEEVISEWRKFQEDVREAYDAFAQDKEPGDAMLTKAGVFTGSVWNVALRMQELQDAINECARRADAVATREE